MYYELGFSIENFAMNLGYLKSVEVHRVVILRMQRCDIDLSILFSVLHIQFSR